MDNVELIEKLKLTFSTPSGKDVLNHWDELYVQDTAVQDTVEKTYYKLGIKEWIQSVILDVKSEAEDYSVHAQNAEQED